MSGESVGKDKKSMQNNVGYTSLLTFVILALAWFVGFASRLFAIVRFESIIHEFDPWFNYRATHYMVENGFYEFLNWFDERAWYPLGRIVGGTVYPGLMVTSGAIHYVLSSLNITVHIRDVCVFLAPTFSGLTAIATYFLTKELWSAGAGLFAACFIAISPGYTSRSVAGSYDNEGIAIFALQFTYYLWVRSVKTGSMFWAALTAISYFYMVSAWGGYVFIINLIPLHVLVLILSGNYSNKVYIAFTTFYTLGQLMAMQIPFVGFQPVKTSEHMAAAGIFGLLQLIGGLRFMQGRLTRKQFIALFIGAIVFAFSLGLLFIAFLTYAGYIAPWSGRFYSLWDTGYAKIHIPIIASVSEHQPTTWVSFFFDLHITAAVFPAGLWFCVKNVNSERIFVILYAISAVYFAGVMVRLMLTLTPVVCILAGIAFSTIFDKYMVEEGECKRNGDIKDSKETTDRRLYDKAASTPESTDQIGMNARSIVLVALLFILLMYVAHCTYVTSNAYSHPSVVLQSHTTDGGRIMMDDFREAYYWLQTNTPDDARIMSWWDYGYQIAGMGNRTTLVDNNTWNNSHIALVGMAMSSNESFAYEIMKQLDVDYVLVIFGGVIGYSGDDINKFLWMVRIAEGEHPKIIREGDYFTESGEYSVGAQASETMLNSIMYKMSYYRFGELRIGYNQPAGFDRTRGYVIGRKDISLEYLEEAYTTENWLVRIYKVVHPHNRPNIKYQDRQVKTKKSPSLPKKTKTSKKGVLNSSPTITKGKKPQAA
ncbi:oligosaccharyl transferase STT3 subunit domain-containing protein [Ditylenchus destructor]|uniref:dolichyl-diphosphooligosaccharide--protein glycotransferase n=1 Tax=Ditylenchus destructor TaxID=166010 RepID=A0AAD4NLJ7_9BILA|nr:oligosaccharyl transferase STT3 subunit domain-containing protein [Ditylenchus destructor]